MATIIDPNVPSSDIPDSDLPLPDINSVDVRVGDIDLFVDSNALEQVGAAFVYKAPTKRGLAPRNPKATLIISGPREWMPSALLGRPSPTKARLLIKLLRKYGQSSEGLEWVMLRQRADAVYLRLSNAERDVFLAKVKRIGERTMRFEAKLKEMTVPLFVYWLERDQKSIFGDVGKLEPSTNNNFEYDAALTAIVGRTGNTLHMNIFSIWVHQIEAQTVLVDWEEMQGLGRWAERMETWVNFRFGAESVPIVLIQREATRLSDKELNDLKIVRGWLIAKRNRGTQEEYCSAVGITPRTLRDWLKKYVELGLIRE